MPSKDAISSFDRIGFLLSLFLIFLIAADAAYSQGNRTIVVYQTGIINTRPVSRQATTNITYSVPASYSRYGDNMYDARGVRYVALRGNSYSNRPRYVVVRSSGNNLPMTRTRYIAARNVDIDDAPRYVAIRQYPNYVDTGTARYIAVHNDMPRTRYVAVRYSDYDDYAPRYAAVRPLPVYDTGRRYVAVSNINDYNDEGTKYVAVRNIDNGCECAGTLRSSLDGVETTSPPHVVIKSDYLAGTQEVVYQGQSVNDTAAYNEPPIENVSSPKYVAYTDAGYSTSPEVVSTRAVSYVPAGDVDDIAFRGGNDTPYIVADNAASTMSYIPVVDHDEVIAAAGTNYIAADDVSDNCSCPITLRKFEDDVGASTVSYVPVDNVEDMDAATASYVPTNDREVETVSYVPVDSVDYVDTSGISAY